MKLLEDMIRSRGQVCDGGILKVGSFFNQQIDIGLAEKIGAEFCGIFSGYGVTKVLTIEASGIVMACSTAMAMGVPMVFAKKTQASNSDSDAYSAKVVSYTRGRSYTITVPCEFISPADTVLIIDDFLATGNALMGLIGIVNAAGAKIAGVGIGIEKAFQSGGDKVRSMGIRVESLARIAAMDPVTGVEFVR